MAVAWVPFRDVHAAPCRRAYLCLASWLLLMMAALGFDMKARAATQAPAPFAPASPALAQKAFTHITIEQGLSDQRVNAIAQDKAGFMWFATANGLNRYDGYTVVSYRNDPSELDDLSDNYVLELYEDRSGTIWVGTGFGLNAFDRTTECFTTYHHDPANPRGLSDNFVTAIYEDRSGELWIGTPTGLNRLDRSTGTFTVYHAAAGPGGLSSDNIRAITEDRSGGLWIGTMSGLNRFDRRTGRFTVFRHDPGDPRSLSHDVVWAVLEDRAGRLWVGTDGGGVNLFDPVSGGFTRYRHDPNDPRSLSHDRIACFFEDASGALWIGTFGGGLSVLDPARQHFTRYRYDSTVSASLSSDYVTDIVADRSGLIWIGTLDSGVALHDPHSAFTIYRHDRQAAVSLASSSVATACEDRDGNLWVGTQDRGLDRFDRRSGRVVHYPADPTDPRRLGHPWVAALEPDPKGALWVGTYGGGLYRFDPALARFTAFRHDPGNPRSLSDDTITALHLDRSGILWIGTRGAGLNRFEPASGEFTSYWHDPADSESLSHGVLAIAEDLRGDLWIGSQGGGLTRLERATGRLTPYRHDPKDSTSLSHDSVNALHMDRSGMLWVGTLGGGLDRFDPTHGTFIHYRERDGLASDRIIAILEDGRTDDPAAGNLWIATGRGLSKLGRDRKTFQTVDTTQGLPLAVYNRGAQTTRQGELLIGSSNGLIVLNPAAVAAGRDSPSIVLTNFLLSNRPVPIGENSPLKRAIDQTSSITLTYADRIVSFEFAALNYRAPGLSRYRYRLEGFDDDWIEVGSTQRLVTYTNLAPGTYVFRVTAANVDGVWNSAGRAVSLVVTPPWWATLWFRGLALALVVLQTLVLVGLVLERRRRRRAEIDSRRHLTAMAHLDRRAAMGELATSLAHELNQPLSAILHNADAAQMLLTANSLPPGLDGFHDIIGDIRKADIRASEVIRRMRALLEKHELESHPVDLNVVAQETVAIVRPDARARETQLELELAHSVRPILGDRVHLQQVILNLLMNAIDAVATVAPEQRRVKVCTTQRDGNVRLAVADSGIGIRADRLMEIFEPFYTTKGESHGMGMGLAVARHIVEAHNGHMGAENNVGGGATVWFSVPVSPASHQEPSIGP